MKRPSHIVLPLVAALVLAACGGGDDNSTPPPPVTVQAPAITTGPASSSVTSGSTATLSVAATGDTLAYQWRLDGVNIAGATAASYTTPALSAADSGKSYTVVVSNSAGSVTSTAAVLTVNPVAAAVALTQQSASQLVTDVNAGVAQLQQADAVGALPFGAQFTALPVGATFSQSLACSTLGTSGSGAINYTITSNDTTGQPVSVSYDYANCSFGSEGFNYSINGTGSLTYSNWTSVSSYTFTINYNLSYSLTSAGYNDSGTLNGTQTCTVNGDLEDCSLNVGGNNVRDVQISSVGSVTTVQAGRISNSLIDCVYNGWVFDDSNGRATAGTVTVTAPNGDRAVITATTTGYTVVITVGGVSQTFTVAFAA